MIWASCTRARGVEDELAGLDAGMTDLLGQRGVSRTDRSMLRVLQQPQTARWLVLTCPKYFLRLRTTYYLPVQ